MAYSTAPKYVTVLVPLQKDNQIKVYASPKIAKALEEVMLDMDIYKGVRLAQVLEAVYNQGKKDGAFNVFTAIEDSISTTKDTIPHRPPGPPKKKKKAKSK